MVNALHIVLPIVGFAIVSEHAAQTLGCDGQALMGLRDPGGGRQIETREHNRTGRCFPLAKHEVTRSRESRRSGQERSGQEQYFSRHVASSMTMSQESVCPFTRSYFREGE
jgi:hypothetical protein